MAEIVNTIVKTLNYQVAALWCRDGGYWPGTSAFIARYLITTGRGITLVVGIGCEEYLID